MVVFSERLQCSRVSEPVTLLGDLASTDIESSDAVSKQFRKLCEKFFLVGKLSSKNAKPPFWENVKTKLKFRHP